MQRQHVVSEPSALGSCGGGASGDDAGQGDSAAAPCETEAGGVRRAGGGAMSLPAGCGVMPLGGEGGVMLPCGDRRCEAVQGSGAMPLGVNKGGVIPSLSRRVGVKPTMIAVRCR